MKAFARVAQQHPARLIILGEGQELARLKKVANVWVDFGLGESAKPELWVLAITAVSIGITTWLLASVQKNINIYWSTVFQKPSTCP